MNLLALLLPGVRDLRTPLAVGVLWSIFLVLLEPRLPDQIRSGLAVLGAQVQTASTLVPAVVQTSLLALAVYLVGVILSHISRGVIGIIAPLIDQRIWVVIVALIAAILYPAALLAVGAAATLVLITIALFTYTRRPGKTFSEFAKPLIDLMAASRDSFVAAVVSALESITTGSSVERMERTHFLREDSARRVLRSPFMRNRLSDDIQGRTLIRALSFLQVDFDSKKLLQDLESPYIKSVGDELVARFEADAILPESLRGDELNAVLDSLDRKLIKLIADGKIVRWRDLSDAKLPYYGPTAAKVFKSILLGAIESDPEVARRFVWQFTRVSLPAVVLDQRIAEARVRLKVEQPGIYDEYDRLRSEAEFRTAIAIPLAALAVLLGYALAGPGPAFVQELIEALLEEVAQVMDPTPIEAVYNVLISVPWMAWIVGAILLGLYIAAGRVKDAEAARLLYASVRQQVMKIEDSDLFQDSDVIIRPTATRGTPTPFAPN